MFAVTRLAGSHFCLRWGSLGTRRFLGGRPLCVCECVCGRCQGLHVSSDSEHSLYRGPRPTSVELTMVATNRSRGYPGGQCSESEIFRRVWPGAGSLRRRGVLVRWWSALCGALGWRGNASTYAVFQKPGKPSASMAVTWRRRDLLELENSPQDSAARGRVGSRRSARVFSDLRGFCRMRTQFLNKW